MSSTNGPDRMLDRSSAEFAADSKLIGRLRSCLAPRFVVEREIGRGGMSTVFLARDVKHDRDVALKVLHPHLAGQIGSERFLSEVRTTARLQHPHILPLFDSGLADGLLYYVAPYIEGETLADLIGRGPLPVHEVLQFGSRIADVLAYAHANGVVHRDIKPANVLVSGEGHVCVADFGLARALHSASDQRLTVSGIIVGSPLYMSPEQIQAEDDVDGNADSYSLGCVLFEMLTGRPPFEGRSVREVLTKHLTQEPPSLRTLRPDVPPALERIVLAAMEKDRANRPTAAWVRTELERVAAIAPVPSDDSIGALHASARTPGGRRHVPGAGVHARRRVVQWPVGPTTAKIGAAVLLLAVTVGIVGLDARAPWASAETGAAGGAVVNARSIAVLPFEQVGGDPDTRYYSNGIADDIRTSLSRSTHLRVISPNATADLSGDSAEARGSGRLLGVDAVLTGSVEREGERLRISARLVDTQSGHVVWEEEYDREAADVFDIERQITDEVRIALLGAPRAREEGRDDVDPTSSLTAYDFYLQGRRYLNSYREPNDLRLAAGLFDQALAIDPSYVRAVAGKAEAYQMLYQYTRTVGFDSAVFYSRRAIALNPRLPDGYTTLGRAYMSDDRPAAARAELERALSLDPNNAVAVSAISRVLGSLGRHDEALRWAKRAAVLDPVHAREYARAGEIYIYLDDYERAREWIGRALRLEPDELWANYLLVYLNSGLGDHEAAAPYVAKLLATAPNAAWTYLRAGWFELMRGDYAAALRYYERADSMEGGPNPPDPDRIYVLVRLGRLAEATELFQAFERRAMSRLDRGHPYIYSQLARANAALGRTAVALNWLEAAYSRGERDLYDLKYDPLLSTLRKEPRFQELEARVRADVARMRARAQAQGG